MLKQRQGWEVSEGVKYNVSPFEEQEFKKYYENGGKEILGRRLYFFDYAKRKCPVREKEDLLCNG